MVCWWQYILFDLTSELLNNAKFQLEKEKEISTRHFFLKNQPQLNVSKVNISINIENLKITTKNSVKNLVTSKLYYNYIGSCIHTFIFGTIVNHFFTTCQTTKKIRMIN